MSINGDTAGLVIVIQFFGSSLMLMKNHLKLKIKSPQTNLNIKNLFKCLH